jgi:hypothetical protein
MTVMLAAWIRCRHRRTRAWGTAASVIAAATVVSAFLAVLPASVHATVTSQAGDGTRAGNTRRLEIGASSTFWALDWATGAYLLRSASAEYVGEHVIVYLENQAELSTYSIDELGEAFDSVIYPTLTSAYGSEPNPGLDGDPRVIILIYDFNDPMSDINASFNPWDVDPDGSPYSNLSEMFYLNVNALHAQTGSAPALAAHEFSHLLVYNQDVMLDASPDAAPESSWLGEGFSTYGEHLCGYDRRVDSWLMAFTRDANFSLTNWQGLRANYGASYSFMYYLAQREGADFIRALAHQPLDGVAGIDATLASFSSSSTFASLFDDWVLTGLVDGCSPQSPPYLFDGLSVSVNKEALSGVAPFLRTAQVEDFGAVYVEFPAASPSKPFQLVFDGADGAPLQAALISWDSAGTLVPSIDRFDLANDAVGDTLTGPLGYDRHVLAVWSRGTVGVSATYAFTYSGTTDPPGGIQFLDMGGDDDFYKYVAVLVDRGVVSGREAPEGSGLWFFNGKQNVLRAQFAKMIMEATELHTDEVDNVGHPTFKDVPAVWNTSGYPYDYVEEAAELGIVSGYSGGRFGPYEPIKRSQLVLMIIRGAGAAGKPLPEYRGDEKVFADVPPSHPYYHEIMAAYTVGIMSGSIGSNGRLYFYSYAPASRNHVAKMTANLLAYLAIP